MKQFLLLFILSLMPSIMAEDDKLKEADHEISTLVPKLGAEKFEQREEAQSKLVTMGVELPEFAVRNYLNDYIKTKDPEVRFRLKNVIRILVLKNYFRPKGFIGISMQPARIPQKIGDEVFLPVEIVTVIPDFPADKSGFNSGDQILKVDGKACNEKFQSTELVNYISAKNPGTKMTFLLQSDGKLITKELVIAERPALPNEPTIEEQQEEFFRKWFRENLKAAEKKLSSKH
jgi:C-terminal processing protease CtpA/Prc